MKREQPKPTVKEGREGKKVRFGNESKKDDYSSGSVFSSDSEPEPRINADSKKKGLMKKQSTLNGNDKKRAIGEKKVTEQR